MRVALVGGTGKTGRSVAAALASEGHQSVPLGRSAWTDLAGALAGCDAAYLIAPNLHPDEPAYVAAALGAARAAGVDRVVYHSVASPGITAMPHHAAKARAEELVRASASTWTILQPGAYLQNLDLGTTVRLPYRASAPFGFADLDEVGRAAAVVLLEDGHEGATYELASVATTVAALASEAGVEVVVDRPSGEPAGREEAWLRSMFAYYDAHGLPVGTQVLRWLLAGSSRGGRP